MICRCTTVHCMKGAWHNYYRICGIRYNTIHLFNVYTIVYDMKLYLLIHVLLVFYINFDDFATILLAIPEKITKIITKHQDNMI